MANTSLSSARRGRAHVSRDYTSKLRTDIYSREATRKAKMSTIGMIGSFAAGAAELSSAMGTNVKGWERLQKGGEELHKEGKHKGDFDLATSLGRGDKPISTWEKWTTQAPVTEQLSIGDDQFYGVNVAQVGTLGKSAGLLVDKDSDKNLYDYLKIGGDKGAITDINTSLETPKGLRPDEPVVKKIAAQTSSETGTARFPKPDIVKPLTEKFALDTTKLGAKTDFSAYPEIESDLIPSISAEDLFQEPPQTRYKSSNIGWDQFDELMSPLRNY